MKVGLDLRCLPSDGSEGAGVAHAARALCSRLVKDQNLEWIAYVVKGTDWQGGRRCELPDQSSISLKCAIRKNPCDFLFVLSGAVSYGLDIPAIPWVHDLIIFDHPEWFPESWLHRQLTTRLFLRGIKRAPIIFAVSEYTKQAIIRYTQVSQEKVIVTHEGGDGQLTINNEQLIIKKAAIEYCRGKWRIVNPFVLALGTVEPRKNLAMLIRAWKKSQNPLRFPLSQGGLQTISLIKEGREVLGVDLVIAGRNGWKFEDVSKEIDGLTPDEASRLHRIEDFNDDDKRQLLLAASIVAVPSLDEGFGLVALEALQAGTGVIASNRGALPEVVGEAGLLLDPEDGKAWTQALTPSPSPIELSSTEEGRQQAQKFSWEKTAKVVLEGLKKL